MRRAVAAAVLVVLAALPSRAAPDDASGDAGATVLWTAWSEDAPPSFAQREERDVDVDRLPEILHPFVAEVRASPATFEMVALRRRARGAADAFLASTEVLATPDALAALRAELAAGTLVEAGRTTLVAEAGEPVSAEDLTEVRVAGSSDIESAIGAAVSFPSMATVRTGLSARLLAMLGEDGAWVVRFRVAAGADATLRDVDTVAGPRVAADIPAFAALGTAVLRDGETAVARGIRDGGDGFVVLVRALHAPDLRLPRRIGDGWVALPGDLWRSDGNASLGYVGTSPPLTYTLEDPLQSACGEALAGWEAELQPVLLDEMLALTGADRCELDIGTVFFRAEPDGERALVEGAAPALRARAPRVLVVEHYGTGRIVVPSCGGHAARGFLGRVHGEAEGVDVETGCHSCIAVAPYVERASEGLSFAAVLDAHGGAELDVCAQVEEEREARTFRARRSLPGHATFTFDELTQDFVTARVVRVRTRVPPGGGIVAGEIDVGVVGDGFVDAETDLSPLDVDGRRLWLGPGGSAYLLVQHRTPHVVDWGAEHSCGMTYRWPFVSSLPAGIQALLRRADVGTLDVTAIVRRPPNVHDPAFDMQDGVVEVLRQPFLLLRTRLPYGDLGTVARGAGCALRLEVPGAPRAALRATRVTTAGETFTVRHADGGRVLFAAGGTWWLPEEIDGYVSNHLSAEATVAPIGRQDGVLVVLGAQGDGVARGRVAVRARPVLTSYDVTKHQAPSRPDTDVSLLLPDQLVRRLPLVVPLARDVVLATPGGLPDPVEIRFASPSTEDDE